MHDAICAGMWDLLYTTTPGASGGKLGPFIGDVQQEVDIAEGVYINYVRLGPLTGKLDATWEVINNQQWKVMGGVNGRWSQRVRRLSEDVVTVTDHGVMMLLLMMRMMMMMMTLIMVMMVMMMAMLMVVMAMVMRMKF